MGEEGKAKENLKDEKDAEICVRWGRKESTVYVCLDQDRSV